MLSLPFTPSVTANRLCSGNEAIDSQDAVSSNNGIFQDRMVRNDSN